MQPLNETTYQAGMTQAFVNRRLQRICDAILKPYNITKMQWLIIGNVLDAKEKGIRVSDLAEKLGTTMSFLTTSINTLESRGILERRVDDADTRVKQVVVSKSYVATCQDIEKTLRDGLRKTIYANIDPQDFRVYLKVMHQLAQITAAES